MRCNNCGWDNAPGATRCERCNAQLKASASGWEPDARTIVSEPTRIVRKKSQNNNAFGGQTSHFPPYNPQPKIKRRVNLPLIIIALVALVLLGAGIYIWDYNRVKYSYYKDYVEYWGVPKGIGRLSDKEVAHRTQSYKFEYNKHKVRRVTLVNSKGNAIRHTDSEHTASRFDDLQFFYTDNGKLDYVIVSNCHGRVLYKMDYDDKLKTVTLRHDDEYGTEMNLDANTNDLYKDIHALQEEKSRISRYLLTYNDKGLLTEKRYAGLQNVPACDKHNIYGSRYKYDKDGRKIEEAYIGADGDITTNRDGMAIRQYTYDDDDNWTSVTYLNADGDGSHDGNNCSYVEIEYDKYGNRIVEMYYTLDGKPAIRSDVNAAGFRYEIDDEGNVVAQISIGVDGNTAYNKYGFVTQRMKYNEDGFVIETAYVDENDSLVMASFEGDNYALLKIEPDSTDLPLGYRTFDDNRTPVEMGNGVFCQQLVFDKNGNVTSRKYFDKDGEPTLCDGFYHEWRVEYDGYNNKVKESYYDISGNPATQDGNISAYTMEYNRQGALIKVNFLDVNGKLMRGADNNAGFTVDYDEIGNIKYTNYFDPNGKPVNLQGGYSKIEYVYDPVTNFMLEQRDYNTSGKLVDEYHWEYDKRGNTIKSYALVDGKLKSGTYVENNEYDSNNRVVSKWASDLNGKKINIPGLTYSQTNNEYDAMGNCIVSTNWKGDGSPALDEQKSHKRVREFDMMNRVVAEYNYGIDGKPIKGADVSPEGHVKYDQWGNMAEISCYDGYGKPRLSADGFFLMKTERDRRGNIVKLEYFGVNGQPICSKSTGYAKVENEYDNFGNLLKAKYYDASKCVRIDHNKYNGKKRLTEQRVCDGNDRLSDQFYGVSLMTIDYDETGLTPKTMKYYDQSGSLMGTQTWNEKKGAWNDMQMTGNANTAQSNVSNVSYTPNDNWRDVVKTYADSLPMKIDDNVTLQSITHTSSSVTMVVKMTSLSKYDLSASDEEELREVGKNAKQMFRQGLSLPNSVSLTVNIQDKAGRTICSL